MSFIHPTSPPETLHAHRPPIKAPGDDEEPQPMPVDPDEGPIDPAPEDDQTPGRGVDRGP
ncbi:MULTISPECIES: hypothetical protein [unclassified Roseateles]|uniref:hypothetical protein n=1 Tax=unclassified Roseateles TaxID=2626991 RepID=UPI0010F69258|nr:hypothetical protein [Paucibacter sp. XJ19-41]MDC6169453.1 hypothetical protein [Paucibacter sp. XJ19-41]